MNREHFGTVMVVMVVLLAIVALSGCISPENILAQPGDGAQGTATPAPTGVSLPGDAEGTGAIISDTSQWQSTPQYYLKTPYGYLLTSPRKGVRLAIIEIKEEVDASGQEYLTGRIKNDENFRINHITLNFNLFNSNGNLIGNAYASVNSLEPGKVWKFTTNSFPTKDYHYYQMGETFIV